MNKKTIIKTIRISLSVLLLIIAVMTIGCKLNSPELNRPANSDNAADKALATQLIGTITLFKGYNYSGDSFAITIELADGAYVINTSNGIDLNNFNSVSGWARQINSVRLSAGSYGLPALILSDLSDTRGDQNRFITADTPYLDMTFGVMSAAAVLPEALRSKQVVTIVARSFNDDGNPYTNDETKAYLCAENEANRPIKANRYVSGDWETFDLTYLDPDHVFFTLFAHANSRYVCADRNLSGSYAAQPIVANRTQVGWWEIFKISSVITAQPDYTTVNLISMTHGRQVYVNKYDGHLEAGKYSSGMVTKEFMIKPVAPVYGQHLTLHPYIADPSAHYFNGRYYIYASHDPDLSVGDPFQMTDYYVYSMQDMNSPLEEFPYAAVPALSLQNIPWASGYLWAPDAAQKGNNFYFYFPAKAKSDGLNHIGVADSTNPCGPFSAQPNYIPGSFSIDQSVFADTDGNYYMIFGGLWGGELEKWQYNVFEGGKWVQKSGFDAARPQLTSGDPALGPMIVKMSADMHNFAETPRAVEILNADGTQMTFQNDDTNLAFFEAPWLNKENNKYYLSYSTGPSRIFAIAESTSIYGPYKYVKNMLTPADVPAGWTTHASFIKTPGGEWFAFYHDSVVSGGIMEKRNIKYKKLASFP